MLAGEAAFHRRPQPIDLTGAVDGRLHAMAQRSSPVAKALGFLDTGVDPLAEHRASATGLTPTHRKALVTAGVLEERKVGSAWLLRFKPGAVETLRRLLAEEEAAAAAAAARQAATARPRRKSAAVVLEERLARIEEGIRDILAHLRGEPRPAQAPRPDGDPSRSQEDIKTMLLDAVRELDALHRYGGLVPIPAVRKAASQRGIADALVAPALEALEREYRVDLNIAQAPTQVQDRHLGIERPGRGLLYYVTRRDA